MTGVPVRDFDRIDKYMKKPTTPNRMAMIKPNKMGEATKAIQMFWKIEGRGSRIDHPGVIRG